MIHQVRKLSSIEVLILIAAVFVFLTVLIFGCGPEWVIRLRMTDFTVKNGDDNIVNSGSIGDTFGGSLGPLVAWLAACLTFAAFWIQYQANVEQRDQFKKQANDTGIQRFESTFFEMLKLHKENVNEIEIEYGNEKLKGRIAFQQASSDLKRIFMDIQRTFTPGIIFPAQNDPVQNLSDTDIEQKLFPHKFHFAYTILFWGRAWVPQIELGGNTYSFTTPIFQERPYDKWHAFFGHYYRHLFLLVKFVVESDVFEDYEEKMKYLKILRAQLSNYEQIMLFYNWLATGYGNRWEDDQNKFLTKYKMIHNLWCEELIDHLAIIRTINDLIDIYNKNPGDSPLFEFQGNDFDCKLSNYELLDQL